MSKTLNPEAPGPAVQTDDGLTDWERSVGAVTVPAADLRVGDVLVVMGGCHRIDRFEPYTGPQVADGTFPWDTRVAFAGTSEMTLTAPEYRILPRPVTQ